MRRGAVVRIALVGVAVGVVTSLFAVFIPWLPTSASEEMDGIAFTFWFAGGGVKGGISYGETDEVGFKAAVNKVHVNDLPATILHLLGLNHVKLTYRYNGRDFRLTDVGGNVVTEILA